MKMAFSTGLFSGEETGGTEEFRPYASPSRVAVIRPGVGVSGFQFWRLGGNHSGTYIRPPKLKCGDPTPAPVTKRKGEEIAAQNLRTATKLSTFVVRSSWSDLRQRFAREVNSRIGVPTPVFVSLRVLRGWPVEPRCSGKSRPALSNGAIFPLHLTDEPCRLRPTPARQPGRHSS
jgi:hypothetical protein